MGFPVGSVGKESICRAGDMGLIPGSGRSPGKGNGNPLQYSCLGNCMDRGAWWAIVHGVTRVSYGQGLVTKPPPLEHHKAIPKRRKYEDKVEMNFQKKKKYYKIFRQLFVCRSCCLPQNLHFYAQSIENCKKENETVELVTTMKQIS